MKFDAVAVALVVVRAGHHRSGSMPSCIEQPAGYTSLMPHLTLPVIVESDSDGYFVFCPSLQGCYIQGDVYEEEIENIKDAIRLHIEDRLAEGEEIPQPELVSLSTVPSF